MQAEELEGRAHAISRHDNVHWRRQRVHHGVSKTVFEHSSQKDGLSSLLAVKLSFNLLAQIRMHDEYAEHFTPLQPAHRQAAACPCTQISRGDEMAAVAPACSQHQVLKEEYSWRTIAHVHLSSSISASLTFSSCSPCLCTQMSQKVQHVHGLW